MIVMGLPASGFRRKEKGCRKGVHPPRGLLRIKRGRGTSEYRRSLETTQKGERKNCRGGESYKTVSGERKKVWREGSEKKTIQRPRGKKEKKRKGHI